MPHSLGEFVYENDSLSFISTPEGRILPRPSKVLLTQNGTLEGVEPYTYEYHHKDHLGNLRVSFYKGTPVVRTTMETQYDSLERAYFENMNTRQTGVGQGGHGVLLNANLLAPGTQDKRTMGPATVLMVSKGDSVQFKGFSRYASTAATFTAVATSVGTVYGKALGEAALGTAFAAGIPFGLIVDNSNSKPRAYARIVFVNEDGEVLQSTQQLIASGAGSWKALSLSAIAPANCYAVVFVANESPVNVYFDDIEVSHPHLVVAQETHYYPFGLEIKPLAREGGNRWKYNGKELEQESQVYDFSWRVYDHQVARTWQLDPKGEKFYSHSPYSWVKNNPISRIDPTGQTDFSINDKTGEVKLVKGTESDGPDRLLKEKNGSIYKKNGELRKVIIGDVAKGILKDGQNFKNENTIIPLGGEGGPSQTDVETFALKLSSYIVKEIMGAYFSQNGNNETSHMTLGMYKNNELKKSRATGHHLGVQAGYTLIGFFHTHPDGYEASDRLRPSDEDLEQRDNALLKHPNLIFNIITSPRIYGDKYPYTLEYTKW